MKTFKEKLTAVKDIKNSNCYNIYFEGNYWINVGAESEKKAIDLAIEEQKYQQADFEDAFDDMSWTMP